MDLFEKPDRKQEEKEIKKAVQAVPPKHHKRYGSKKPDKFRKSDILSWREDL